MPGNGTRKRNASGVANKRKDIDKTITNKKEKKMAKKKVLEEPSLAAEQELSSLINAETSYVDVRGKKWKSAPLHNGTLRKMTDIVLNETEEDKVNAKCAAVFYLNNYWKIKYLYWIVWRWFYYFREYRNGELLPYILECKKKVELEAYIYTTMSLIGMKDTEMAKRREEVQRILQGQAGEAHSVSVKNTPSSSKTGTTSSD